MFSQKKMKKLMKSIEDSFEYAQMTNEFEQIHNLIRLDTCLGNVYLEVKIEEGAFPLHFQGESRCDLGNLNIAWSLSNSILGEF